MICILVFACVLFRQGETNQGTSEEKKTGMIFDGQESVLTYKACNSLVFITFVQVPSIVGTLC